MEEKKITEQESLELIARMIESTKENLEVGRGNRFLYFGYFGGSCFCVGALCRGSLKSQGLLPIQTVHSIAFGWLWG